MSRTRTLSSLLLPVLMPVLMAWLALRFVGERAGWREAVFTFCLAGYATGVWIGWRFHRSRVVLCLAVVALSWLGLEHLGEAAGVSPGRDSLLLSSIGMLLPVNLALWAVLPERGLATLRGLWRWSIVLGQALVVWYVVEHRSSTFAVLVRPVASFPDRLGLPVSQVVLGCYLLSAAVLLVCLWRRRTAVESSLVGALAVSFIALISPPGSGVSQVYWGAVGWMLTLGFIERSYSLAYRDELTGLPGRRALTEALRQQTGTYTVAVVDVDHFKRFNDRYGHDVGDQALRLVARHLTRVEGGGRPFRYGGEEFSLLFPGRTADQAVAHLENLRQAIQKASFIRRSPLRPRRKPARPARSRRLDRRISLTVSMGAASPGPGRDSPDQVLKAADRLMYRSKKGGRNRLTV